MSELPVLTECPFCDHAPRYQEDDSAASGGYNYWVLCGECGATSDYYATPEEAATAWNRRTPQPVTPAGGEVEPSAMFSAICRTIALHFQAGKWITGPNTLALALEAVFESAHPPVADAALVVDEAMVTRAANAHADYEVANFKRRRTADDFHKHTRAAMREALVAALNQRGGGA